METVNNEECAICKNDVLPTANRSTTPCGHSFHFTCLARSMAGSAACPICRASLRHDGAEVKDDRDIEGGGGGRGVSDGATDHDDDDDDDGGGGGGGGGGDEDEREEGELRLPLRGGRIPRREVVITELSESDGQFFGNEVDLRREIMEGILHSMCRQGDLTEVRNLLDENPHLLYSRGNTGDLLSHEAVLSDNETMLSYLLTEKSFDANLPNDVHDYPLHYAVRSGSLRMVTILVNHRAFVDCTSSSKKTPLMVACEEEDHDIVEILLDRGASTLTHDAMGNRPIHYAVKSRAQACLRRLLSSDADVNATNHMEETPLFVACKLGFHGVSRTLLRSGADPESGNKFGTTPVDEAAANGSSGLCDLLRRYI